MENNYKYWVARDKNGRLFIYDTPIFKDEKYGHWSAWGDVYLELHPNSFPEVKWEDEEPRAVYFDEKGQLRLVIDK